MRGSYDAKFVQINPPARAERIVNVMKSDKFANATQETEALDSVTTNTSIIVAPVETSIQVERLTPAEVQLLAKCEKIIGKGLKAFMPVCEALQEIWDQRLYRAEYRTFDDYCLKQWGITSRHANRVLAAGAVVTNIESDQLVSSEPAAIPKMRARQDRWQGWSRISRLQPRVS